MKSRANEMMLMVNIQAHIEELEEKDDERSAVESLFYRGVMAGALAAAKVCGIGVTSFEAMQVIMEMAEQLFSGFEDE